MQSDRAMSRCGYNGNVGGWLRGRSVSVFPLPLQAIASTTLIRRNAKFQDGAVQSLDSEELASNVQWVPFQMAAMEKSAEMARGRKQV